MPHAALLSPFLLSPLLPSFFLPSNSLCILLMHCEWYLLPHPNHPCFLLECVFLEGRSLFPFLSCSLMGQEYLETWALYLIMLHGGNGPGNIWLEPSDAESPFNIL